LPAYIAKTGFTKVGDHWNQSLSELAFAACKNILGDGVKPDAIIVSNAFSQLTSQSNLGPLIGDSLGMENVDCLNVESSGASGGAAIHVANNMICSGQVRSALVVGIEKMRDLEPSKLVQAAGLSENAEYSQFFGVSFSALNALLARLYMEEYGVSREKLSSFPVIAHRNSATAEHAQFKKKFSSEDVSRSELIADPLRTLDCAPVGDGAAAVLLVDENNAKREKHAVKIVASESSSGRINFFERDRMFRFSSTEDAAKKALKGSDLNIDELDFFEIHDSYSILSALIVEALGLSAAGESCVDATSGRYDLSGRFPISTFGGMKARGYPIGAAGIYQICEAYKQLTGQAGANQVSDAKNGLIHSMSGIDGSAFVHILSGRTAS
jgi:acetyl-CoA C-acetyltransferase